MDDGPSSHGIISKLALQLCLQHTISSLCLASTFSVVQYRIESQAMCSVLDSFHQKVDLWV